MVDEALTETGAVQSRIRALPSRAVVYLLLAGALFADCGYGQVWDRLVAGLGSDPGGRSERRRVGAGPSPGRGGPVAVPVRPAPRCGGHLGDVVGALVWAFGLRIDGTIMSVADNPLSLDRFRKHRGHHGGSGYPLMRVMVLVCCGTRT